MSNTAISVENVSKLYRLGLIGGKTLRDDVERWIARLRGRPDPLLKIGQGEHGNREGEYIWALRDVSFEVKEGEVLGIIGRNGAGKSTLLKILSRVTAPTEGQIKIKGRVASLLEVGTGFHPELTGRENIFLNGAILGMSKAEIRRKFDEIVDFSEIEKFIDTPVKRYSSGMYVRLAFAIAAHLEPEILLVDEVLAVGDVAFQNKCLGKMTEVSQGGRTILFVSHNMPSIKSLCLRTLLFEAGSIGLTGSTEQVLPTYLSSFRSKEVANWGEAQGRRGTGTIRFTDWTLADGVLGEGKHLTCCRPCIFKLHYESNRSGLKNISVAFVIKDIFNQPILSGSSHFRGTTFDDIGRAGAFLCHLDSMNLMPDMYRVQLWCAVSGEVADYVEDAGLLQIVPDDIYGTGKFPERKHGILIIPHTWTLEKTQA